VRVVSKQEIDDYLASLGPSEQATLELLRHEILELIPDAEQCISYGIQASRLKGKVIAGFAAYKNHLSYFPHSGSVLGVLQRDVASYARSRGALRFRVDSPLPKAPIAKLIAIRVNQAFGAE